VPGAAGVAPPARRAEDGRRLSAPSARDQGGRLWWPNEVYIPPAAARASHPALYMPIASQGFVPLPGMVGYGATVWNPSPTHPPRITEHDAPGGSDPPPQNYGTWCPGGGPTHPPGIAERWPRNLLSLAKERNPGPKNGLERCVLQFYTICDKNQLLNKKIGKAVAILVLTCTGLGAPD
jgi:hypothetical protein